MASMASMLALQSGFEPGQGLIVLCSWVIYILLLVYTETVDSVKCSH